MSQNQMILQHLMDGRALTPIDALNEYGCFRLAGRVYELKKEGWPISCERKAMKNGKVVGVYSLDMDRSLWPE
jgi:hypothetical protein